MFSTCKKIYDIHICNTVILGIIKIYTYKDFRNDWLGRIKLFNFIFLSTVIKIVNNTLIKFKIQSNFFLNGYKKKFLTLKNIVVEISFLFIFSSINFFYYYIRNEN